MVDSIKITALQDIGANIAYTTLVPLVNMAGTPTTQKANLQNLGNLILNGAGGSYFAPAARAILTQSVTNAAQPNITSVGTLSTLTVAGNITAGNINGGNIVVANFYYGDGGFLTNVMANGSYSNSNVANYLPTYTGNVGASNVNVTGTVYANGLSSTGLASLTTLNVSTTANLGAVGNITITGGSNGQALTTNGNGVLNWATVSGGTGGIAFEYNIANFTANALPAAGTMQFTNRDGDVVAPVDGTRLWINATDDTGIFNGSTWLAMAQNSERGTITLQQGNDQQAIRVNNIGVYNDPEVYRGYRAGVNQIWGDDPSINQIIITNAAAPIFYNEDFDISDDVFHATNLADATAVYMVNVYGSDRYTPLSQNELWSFFVNFVDNVIYQNTNTETFNVTEIRTAFYTNFSNFYNSISASAYDRNFRFANETTYYNSAAVTGGTGTLASSLRVRLNVDYTYTIMGINDAGAGYTVGDSITVTGNQLNGATPANDLVLTVNSVDGNGGITAVVIDSGVSDYPWRTDSISDGGDDQYDTGNRINTNLAQAILYGGGNVTVGTTEFGAGSEYAVMYNSSVFCMAATGVAITDLYYSGNLGADGDGLIRWSGLRNSTSDGYDVQYAYMECELGTSNLTPTVGTRYQLGLDSGGINLDQFYSYYNDADSHWYFGANQDWRLESRQELDIQSYQTLTLRTLIPNEAANANSPSINITTDRGSDGNVEFDKQAGSGGSITIQAGDAGNDDGVPTLGANGGSVTIQAGDANGNNQYGGSVTIESGNGDLGYGGNLILRARNGDISDGQIQLTTNYGDTDKTWAFDSNGNLTLPGNTFAVNYANGTPVSIVSELVNGNNSLVLDGDGNIVLEGTPSGNAINRGLVWDYGANANGVNSTVRQDDSGLSVRAWTEDSGNYAAPVNIVTNQDANTKTWEFNGNGNLILPGNLIIPEGNIVSRTIGPAFTSTITGINTGSPTVLVTLAGPVFEGPFSGTVTISSVTGTTEANGVWGYQAIDPSTFQLYTDATLTTPVDGMTWTTYVSGGNAVGDATYTDLTIQGGNVSIGSNDNTWVFGADGNLVLADGNSVIQSIANSSLDPVLPNVSTMVLTPDSGYSSQSLVLDPTAPGHIHLRSPGANIDEPYSNIFLGGETSSFEVGYHNGAAPNLFIHSGNNTWTFDNAGNLTLPGNTFAVNYADGTQVPIGGGGNTGNVTFDDVTVQGVNQLNLSAGPDYTANLAYLQVRAGDVPSHIHFDTGNSEAYDLIVGNDSKFVQVSSTGNIIMSSYDSANSISYPMTLDTTGNLVLPQLTTISDESAIGTTLTVGAPPTVIVISGADVSGVNLTYTRSIGITPPTWTSPVVNPATDPYIEFSNGEYGIIAPDYGLTPLYLNTGTLNLPLAQWSLNPPLGSVAPTAVYTYGAPGPDWVFGADGNLTLPSGGNLVFSNTQIQSSAYAGGNGHAMMIDTNRADTYEANGSADKPFKTFMAAVEAVADLNPGGTVPYTFILMGCNITETVDLSSYNFRFITISTTCRSTFTNPVTIGNSALQQLTVRNIEFGNSVTITGDGTADQLNNTSFYNVSFTGALTVTAANALAFYEAAFFGEVIFNNISYLYINGAQYNSDWTIRSDDTGAYPIPAGGITPGVAIALDFIANDINFIKGGTGTYVFQPHSSRMGRSAESYALPAGWIISAYSSVFVGTWTNNGTWTMRNSSSVNAIAGTAPVYSGIIGGRQITTGPTALANLTAIAGSRAFINNGNLVAAGNFGAQVGAGGANIVPVYSDGTNWYIG